MVIIKRRCLPGVVFVQRIELNSRRGEREREREREMEEAEILEPFQLHYSDLMLLSSDSDSISSISVEEMRRLESISSAIMQSLGPTGPGLLAITGVPNVSVLRRSLLSLARKLAILNNEDRKRILKEHNLGSDVPLKSCDRTVSSFAMQLKYVQGLGISQIGVSQKADCYQSSKQELSDVDDLEEIEGNEFKNLGNSFKELGFRMMELGLCLARVCDRAIGGLELEQSLLESCSAKGRLIHYHSTLDNIIIKENGKKNGSTKGRVNHVGQVNVLADPECYVRSKQRPEQGPGLDTSKQEVKPFGDQTKLWQQWHYDYGIFTVLTEPLFILPCLIKAAEANDYYSVSCEQECPPPGGHTYLQIFDPNKNNVLKIRVSPESFIVQVGESADVLSKGKLHSTLHSVCRPESLKNYCRETFVVFLQPAWGKTFSISNMEQFIESCQCCNIRCEKIPCAKKEHNKLTQEIRKIVPPLSSRLKDGMTFAEFSQETTKQYYGGRGLQSNR